MPHDPEWLSRQVDTGRVEGMIIIGQSNQSDVINSVARYYDPLVVWGAKLPDQIYCSVGSDNRMGGRLGVLRPDGTFSGTIGGGCGEAEVWQEAMETMRDGKPRVVVVDLTEPVEGDDKICGGVMHVFVERVSREG